MLEPLSPRLTGLLLEFGLCRPKDIRRCRRTVKRLTSDLPAFDSVWIDALVRRKALTPFQAAVLESDRPERIAAGGYLLIERLGGSARSETFLARSRQKRKSRAALKQLRLRPEQLDGARERLQLLCTSAREIRSPLAILPREVISDGGDVVVVSPYLAGLNLRDLIVRRGRFPSRVVRAIARQIVAGLKVLGERNIVHGDLRLENVKLSPEGRAVLTEVGIRAAVTPHLTFVAELPSEHCEAIAPELIATGREPDFRSDLYSLGCVLWNLLTGRPAVKEADPLEKLAAHQRRTIGDVREWAPDVPADLADAVSQLTRANPDDRPQTIAEAEHLFGKPRRGDRRAVRSFQSYFLSQAPAWTMRDRTTGGIHWKTAAAMLFLLSGVSAALFHEGARNELLDLATRISEETKQLVGEAEPIERVGQSQETGPIALPVPDAEGVIVLDTDGPYAAGEIAAVGPLEIRAKAGVTPIVLSREPLKISCESLTLSGVNFRCEEATTKTSLLLVRSLDLTIRDCSFELAGANGEPATDGIAVAWKSIDPRDRSGGAIGLRNVVFRGGDCQVFFATPPARWTLENCLALQTNAFCRMKNWPDPARPLEATFDHVSLREAGALVRFDRPTEADRVAGQIFLTARQCVFDLRATSSALFAFHQANVSVNLLSHLSLTGEDTLTSDTVVIAGRLVPGEGDAPLSVVALPAETLAIEGLMAAPFDYAGSIDDVPGGSEVIDVSGPRLSSEMPGIDPGGLLLPERDADEIESE